jgi:hypothetical protein
MQFLIILNYKFIVKTFNRFKIIFLLINNFIYSKYIIYKFYIIYFKVDKK